MRAFTYLPGFAPPVAAAVALAALRPGGGPTPYTCTIGPVTRPDGSLWTGVTVEIGLYDAPHADSPIHGTLRGLARESSPGHFARAFFLRDLMVHLPARAGRLIYGAADGPGWRVVLPIRVVPDAQRLP